MAKSLKSIKEQKIIQCLYCGNKTPMDQVGKHQYSWQEENSCFGYFIYSMYSCPVCNKVTFTQSYWDITQTNCDSSDYVDEEILYPVNALKTSALPPAIKNAFESALKVKNIDDSICFLALRRTLELILIDKGATKWGLKDKIEELSPKGILPETLKEASLIVKIFGDSAAHKQGISATIHDINKLVDFIEYLLEYFYILPEKINALKLQLEKSKQHEENK